MLSLVLPRLYVPDIDDSPWKSLPVGRMDKGYGGGREVGGEEEGKTVVGM